MHGRKAGGTPTGRADLTAKQQILVGTERIHAPPARCDSQKSQESSFSATKGEERRD